jgi:hypothetical protein
MGKTQKLMTTSKAHHLTGSSSNFRFLFFGIVFSRLFFLGMSTRLQSLLGAVLISTLNRACSTVGDEGAADSLAKMHLVMAGGRVDNVVSRNSFNVEVKYPGKDRHMAAQTVDPQAMADDESVFYEVGTPYRIMPLAININTSSFSGHIQ